MHAITIDQPGGPDVMRWAQVPDPVPQPGEVLVEVAASAVNRADLLQRAGFYHPPPGASQILGMECSGRIADSNGVPGWTVGDEVCALLAGGGYAEKVAVPAGQLLPVPAGVSLVDAAALPEVACTVWSNLIPLAGLHAGQTLLVHGGGSGIGTFAIQFARALGVDVITTARASKHEMLAKLGARTVIDYENEDFVAEVRSATGSRGADVILDIVGAAYLDRNIAALAPDGHLVIIGLQGGRTGDIDLGALLSKRASISATALRGRTVQDKARIVTSVREQVWPLIQTGEIRPIVDRSLPMSLAVTAHEVVAASDHIGKVLLVTDGAASTGHNREASH
jgi:putative PIG3 family NAD(P)H quinone oxidoreductase